MAEWLWYNPLSRSDLCGWQVFFENRLSKTSEREMAAEAAEPPPVVAPTTQLLTLFRSNPNGLIWPEVLGQLAVSPENGALCNEILKWIRENTDNTQEFGVTTFRLKPHIFHPAKPSAPAPVTTATVAPSPAA